MKKVLINFVAGAFFTLLLIITVLAAILYINSDYIKETLDYNMIKFISIAVVVVGIGNVSIQHIMRKKL